MKERSKPKEMVGTVISDRMMNSIIVETRTHVQHPRYKKTFVRRDKFTAHDEKGTAKLGDTVRIRSCRPLSKGKNWRLSQVIRKGPVRPDEKLARPKKKVSLLEPETTEATS